MALIKQITDRHGAPKFRIDVTLHGKRIRQSFEKRAEAEVYIREAKRANKARLMGFLQIPVKQESLKIKDAIREFYDRVITTRKSEMSRKNEKAVVTEFYDSVHVNQSCVYLAEIRAEHIECYRQELGKRVGPSTVNRRTQIIAAMMNRFVQWGHLEESPMRFIEPLRARPKARAMWTKEEVDKVIEASRDPYKGFYEVTAMTGARPVELASLIWSDVKLNEGLVTFHCWKNSGSGERVFPIDDKLKAVFQRLGKGIKKGDRVFPVTTNAVQHHLAKLRTTLGLRSDLQIYGLRHTFATELVAQNVSTFTIQKLMGHSNVRTTQKYAHAQMGDMRDAIEGLRKPKETK